MLLRRAGLLPYVLSGLALPTLAQAQAPVQLSAGVGLGLLRHPYRAADNLATAFNAQVQAEWPWRPQLSLTAVGRLGRLGYSDNYYGHNASAGAYLYQVGGGLRYADFWYLGGLFDPFVGADLTMGYAPRAVPADIRGAWHWLPAVSVSAGLQGWVLDSGGPYLSFSYHRMLMQPFPEQQLSYPAVDPFTQQTYTEFVSYRSIMGYASISVGWRWQLGGSASPRGTTPRYTEPLEEAEAGSEATDK